MANSDERLKALLAEKARRQLDPNEAFARRVQQSARTGRALVDDPNEAFARQVQQSARTGRALVDRGPVDSPDSVYLTPQERQQYVNAVGEAGSSFLGALGSGNLAAVPLAALNLFQQARIGNRVREAFGGLAGFDPVAPLPGGGVLDPSMPERTFLEEWPLMAAQGAASISAPVGLGGRMALGAVENVGQGVVLGDIQKPEDALFAGVLGAAMPALHAGASRVWKAVKGESPAALREPLRERMEKLLQMEAPTRDVAASSATEPSMVNNAVRETRPSSPEIPATPTAPSVRAQRQAQTTLKDAMLKAVAEDPVHSSPTREVMGGVDPKTLFQDFTTSERIARIEQQANEFMQPLDEARAASPTQREFQRAAPEATEPTLIEKSLQEGNQTRVGETPGAARVPERTQRVDMEELPSYLEPTVVKKQKGRANWKTVRVAHDPSAYDMTDVPHRTLEMESSDLEKMGYPLIGGGAPTTKENRMFQLKDMLAQPKTEEFKGPLTPLSTRAAKPFEEVTADLQGVRGKPGVVRLRDLHLENLDASDRRWVENEIRAGRWGRALQAEMGASGSGPAFPQDIHGRSHQRAWPAGVEAWVQNPAALPQKIVPSPEHLKDLVPPTVDFEMRFDPRTVEMPRGVGTPGSFPADIPIHPEMRDFGVKMKNQLRENQGLLAWASKQLSLPENRAASEVASFIRSWEASKHLQDVQTAQRYKLLRPAVKNNRLVSDFVRQNKNPPKAGARLIRIEELPEEVQNLFKAGFEQMRAQRNELIEAGMFDASTIRKMQALEERGLQWLHRDYHAFMHGRFRADPSKLEAAVNGLVKDAKGKLSFEQAQAEVLAFLDGDAGVPFQQRWRQSKLNKEILTKRSSIPPYLRQVVGEIHDPAFVFATSMGELERLHRQWKVSKSFIEQPGFKGRFWDDVYREGLHYKPVGNPALDAIGNKRMYGEFAGKYVTPEMYEALMQAPSAKVQNVFARVGSALSAVFKTAKIGLSPLTYVRDFVSNSTNAAAAGLPLWHPRTYGRIGQALEAMKAHSESFKTIGTKGGKAGHNPGLWVQWALEDTGIRSGMGAEFAGGSGARAIAARLFEQHKGGDIGSLLERTWKLVNEKHAKLGHVKDAMDNVWRLAVYMEQVSKGKERLGLSIRDARARAASIVNENFASSGSVGHGVRDFARGPFGSVAPFLTWAVDNVRVHKNWLRNSMNVKGLSKGLRSGEGTAQGLNVLLQYGGIAGLFETLRRVNNFTDDDVAAADASLRQNYIENNPLREYLPWRDSMGRPQVVSLGAMFPTATFLRGDPNASWVVRAMGNMAMIPFESAYAEDRVRGLFSSVGMTSPAFKRTPLPDTELRSVLGQIYDFGQTGLERDAINIARRTKLYGQLRRFEEPLTPGQAASRLSGFNVEPIGAQMQAGQRIETAGKAHQAQSDIRRIDRTPEGEEDKVRQKQVVRERLEALRSEQLRRQKAKTRR